MRHFCRPRQLVAGSFAIAVLLLAGFSRAAFASPSLSDNFSEDTQASWWYYVQQDPAEAFNDTGGLLQFTSTAASTEWGPVYVLRENEIEATQDFEVKATWHLAAMSGIQNNQEVDIGLQVMGVGNENLNGDSVELTNKWENDGSGAYQGLGVRIKSNNNDIYDGKFSPTSPVTDGTLYISYTASTDTLYVSLNGYFLPASSNGDWVYSGVVKGQWGASRIVAMLEADAQQVALTSGQSYFSYFEVTEGTMVTPPTFTTTVNTMVNGAPGTVALTFSGPTPDDKGKAAGSYATPFTVKLDQGFPVFLTAPGTDGSGDNFICWQVNGVPTTTDATAQLWPDVNNTSNTLTAVYGGAKELFSDTLTGSAIGPWWYLVEQNSAQVYLQEQPQGLELTSNETSTGQTAYCMLRQRRLDVNNSSGFKVQVDWHFAVTAGTSQLGLMLLGQQGQDESVGISVNYDPTNGGTIQVADSNQWGNQISGSPMVANTATSGKLFIYCDNNNQILYLSRNGYGPFVNNPANGDWVVVNGGFNSNYFIVAIGGSASGVAISSGTAYLDNLIIKKGWFDTPTTGEIAVETNLGSTGVPIYVSPADDSGAGDGTTSFHRTVENDIPIWLSAPATDSGDNFIAWVENNGAEYLGDNTEVQVWTNSSPSYQAIYQTSASTVTVSVQSTPTTGLAIGSNTEDSGTTDYTLPSVTTGANVNLQAPATAGANSFLYWEYDGGEFSTDASITNPSYVSCTLTAVYGSTTTGSLTVTLTPTAAVTAGALWSLDGGITWNQSGATVNGLTAGSVPVAFMGIPGWTSPAGQWVTISSGQTTTTSGAYTENTYTLAVNSTPPTAVVILSSTGDVGTTNYTVPSINYGTGNVNLQAPAVDPSGYTFSQWMLNGFRMPFAQKSITFPMTANATAVALYDTANCYTLDVESTPPAGIAISSTSGQNGTTEYFAANIASGTSVTLQAPATDPPGYAFSEWTLNGTAQTAGQKSVTFTMTAAETAVAEYTLTTYTLAVQSTPLTGLSIGSYSGYGGTTNYTVPSIEYGTGVDLEAPSQDTDGNNFAQWELNGVGQGAGNMYLSFNLPGNTTAVAQYSTVLNLTVQSSPPTDLNISSNTGDNGYTNYTVYSIPYDTSVNLQAPPTDPTGEYTFAYWTLNGTAQTAGQQSITFPITTTTTAVAQYTVTTYALSVQSMPTGLGIGSSTTDSGTTNYTVPSVAYDASVNLQAPATDPTGDYTFSQWMVNGAAQTAGQQSITFTMTAATTAAAQYNFNPLNSSTLLVQSTPAGLGISSTTSDSGTTNYSVPGITQGESVNLSAPATDPSGYVFSKWTLNSAVLTAGQKSVTFSAPATWAAWGSEGGGNGQFDGPEGVAVDAAGNVYVADTYNDRIQKFTSAGAFLTQWGSSGIGNGQFQGPEDIAVDTNGNVYVADTGHNRIQKFTLAGAYIAHWGSAGSGNGQFNYPGGIAVDSSGNVYVADTGNNLIQKFTSAGTFITQWGGSGSGHGQFAEPQGVAVDGAGNVYVADMLNCLIQKFTSAGAFITQWGGYGSGNGQFYNPSGIAVDSTGNVYVVDSGNNLIQKFTSSGTYITQWGGSGSGNGQFVDPSYIAADPNGNVYVADTWNERVQAFYLNILTVAQYLADGTLAVQSAPITGLSIGSSSSDGGTTNYTVPSVGYGTSVNLQAPATDPTGYTFSEWTVNGTAQTAGQKSITFPMPEAATALAQYTLATYTLTVQSTPLFGVSIGSNSGYGGMTPYNVSGVAYGTSVDLEAPSTDWAGDSFVQWIVNGAGTGTTNTQVSFTMTGATTAVAQYTGWMNVSTLLVQSTPTGLSIGSSTGDSGTTNYSLLNIIPGSSVNLSAPPMDPSGYVFSEWTLNGAALTAGQKSVTFSAPATYAAWGSSGSGNGLFDEPIGIAVDAAGNVYVADMYNCLIQKFTSAGAFITQWGGYGSGNGQFYFPEGVAVGPSGNVYVADMNNNLIQEFTPAGVFLAQWGGPGSGNGKFDNPSGIAVDSSGNVYVADTYNNLVQKFTSAGAYLIQWGGSGSGNGQFDYPEGVAVDSAGNVYVADPGNSRIQKFTSAGAFITQWGGYGSGNGQFYEPEGVAVDSSGNVYVADTDNNRIQKFTSAGVYVTQWGGYGSGNGQFEDPYGIAVDSNGNVYVADTANDRVQVFYLNILAVAQYLANGTLAVQSAPITGLNIGSGTGYAGTTNYTVTGVTAGTSVNVQAPAMDPTGYAFSEWTVNGTAETAELKNITFTMPAAATAVAQYAPNIYTLSVQSAPLSGVVVASSTGDGGATNYTAPVAYYTTVNLAAPATDPYGYTFEYWMVNGTSQPSGQKSITFLMTADTLALAQYTVNTYNLTVQSTPLTGLAIGSIAGYGGATNYTDYSISYDTSVDLEAPSPDPYGYTFQQWTLNDVAQTSGQRAITFPLTGNTTAVARYTLNNGTLVVESTPAGLSIGSSTGDGGTTNYTVGNLAQGANVNLQAPATDPTGLYTFSQWTVKGVAQTAGQKSVTFSAPAAYAVWGSYGSGTGQFYNPVGIALDSAGNVYVADTDNCRIQKFTSGGTIYTEWGSYGTGNVQFEYPEGIAVDSSGNVYVADTDNNRIQKFTSNGAYVTKWGSSGSGNDQFNDPEGVAVDSSGNVYVADTNNDRIQKFTSSGVYITQWGGSGGGNGKFNSPVGVAVDGAGNVYVADMNNCLIQKFTSAGAFLTQWGGYGSGNGQFYDPEGIAADSAGDVFVADSDNNRIQMFTTAGAYVGQLGSAGDGPGQFSSPGSIAVNSPGNLFYVADTDNDRIQLFGQNILAVAQYTGGPATLTVQSTPPTGIGITSTGADGGTTNYTVPSVAYGASVNLQAPAADPSGSYTFAYWTLNGAAQTAGQESITFTMTAATTALAQYTPNPTTLAVQSAPTGIAIASDTGQGGTTNYTVPSVAYESSVDLTAPPTDPAGYTFSEWTVNGTAQTSGQKAITFTMTAGTVAVAQYTPNTYTLNVESMPPNELSIGSSTSYPGLTNYEYTGVAYGTSVNLQAPATDPTGYTFSQWTLNDAAQTAGLKSITFTMTADTTAVAQYTPNLYTLSVQSTPPTAIIINSDTGESGTTNYTVPSVAYGTSVDLTAPATDPTGYTFSEWTVNGTAQSSGQKAITFTMTGAMTAVAQYTPITYALTVQTSPAGIVIAITSNTGDSGTTNYTVPSVGYGTSVNLQAPATDPTGYTFSQWTVNSAAQTAGQKNITFTMPAEPTTAVAQYTPGTYMLSVQSTPLTGLGIGSSSGDSGTTDYTVPSIAYDTSVNLQAPAADPTGYTFSKWTLNSAAQTAGQKNITFTMTGVTTAVAQYTPNPYALTVQSTPPTALSIGSNTGDSGTTDYTVPSVGYGTSVNLQAPATDPTGYTFSQWTVNSAAQTAGQKNITFTMTAAATTAVAEYTMGPYNLTVQSTPLTGIYISGTYPGTTNYTVPSIAYDTSVNLQAPAADPIGYTFSKWTLNSAAQTAGQKSITFTMITATTAVAQYTPNPYALTVQSAPPTAVSIGSSTADGGTTNYTVPSVGYGTSVNLQAPATDPVGYTFLQWTVNETAQTAGLKDITFTMPATVTTAVAQYTVNLYALTVESTPPTALSIGSNTGDSGTTSYTVPSIAYDTSVNLQAPAADPVGYTFSQWAVNSAAQTAGLKNITFLMPATATTAVAQYTLNTYALTVQSTPPTGIVIASDTGEGGTTNYTAPSVGYATNVDLTAPATDPTGYTFAYWTIDGATQTVGAKSISFTMPTAAATALAQYTLTPPGILYVNQNATGANNGTSWTNAFVLLQSALNAAASGDQIWVAAGTYAPTYDYGIDHGPIGNHFEMINGVSIYGGFAGTETALSQRNWAMNVTTLTGQATSYFVFYHDNSYNGLSLDNTAVLDGFTITAAAECAMYNNSCSPSIADCTLSLNGGYDDVQAYGGMYNNSCSPTVTNCIFSGNLATYYGGGMYNGSSSPLLTDCAFIGNSAADGGGMFNYEGSPSITNCTFSGNSATDYGGGMCNDSVSLSVTNCILWGDGAPTGAEIYNNTVTATVSYSDIEGSGGSGAGWNSSIGTDGGGNIAADPTFVSPVAASSAPTTTGNYRLQAGSPCINTGNTAAVPSGVTTDLDGNPRFVSVAGTETVDMGAYEYQGPVALTVQSTPPTGIAITSDTGQAGTTNYTVPSVAYGKSVDLTAPATDPTGYYIFSQWTVNGAAETAGANSITFTITTATTAVAQYTLPPPVPLMVQSTPTGIAITSDTDDGGTTNYTVPSVTYGTSVNLTAPATDPTGQYTFSQWTVNDVAQTAGQQSITFTMPPGATTAVAQYALITCTLSVQSAPLTGIYISGTYPGTTNYTVPRVAYGAIVTLSAPLAASGNNFQKWQENGADYSTNPTITVAAGNDTYTAVYLTPTAGYMLAVQSTPPIGLSIGSSTGHGGTTTNYSIPGVGNGTSVNLAAPATDPTGYTFSQWTLNGAAQSPGQKSVTFKIDAAVTAVARYTANAAYTLTVESTPTGVSIGSSNPGQGGTTNYTKKGIAYGASVNLATPATDPTGYSFSQWTLNGVAQTAGQKRITFTMNAAVTAVAQYAPSGYALTVESTPPTGVGISSTTGQKGTTNYGKGVTLGASVNLAAPTKDPAGYTFSQWTLNGAAVTAGVKNITFTMPAAAVTAVARYTLNGYALTVQSTPPAKLVISSSTGQGGTTNYTEKIVAAEASVNLAAPATDPTGYAFSQWTLNGAAQTDGAKSITFTMDAAVTAVAEYTANTSYMLSVQSMPPAKLVISSSTGQAGTTNYTEKGVPAEMSVNLEAPATDPKGYTFSQWTVNGAAQPFGQKSVAFTMDGAVTAAAKYNPGYTLSVQATPLKGLSIGSSTGQGGTTNYTTSGVAYGASVNLQAPETDPAGYTFSQWTVNGAAQTDGQKAITFTMDAAVTAVAHYTANPVYKLSVQSTPKGQLITSSTSDGGTTPYTVSGVTYGTSVNLQAPETDATGLYTFSQWTLNGAAQTEGQKAITFTMEGAVTAVAQYTMNDRSPLTVESTPPNEVSIGSSMGQGGTTNYTEKSVAAGTSVNLAAPATDPSGYVFANWMVGTTQYTTKSITFSMPAAATTATVAYTAVYALNVNSTPPSGLSIGSSTGQNGTTNYTAAVTSGTSVNLQAPATDPLGYAFWQWTVNGAAQTAGEKAITFTMEGAITAVAEYTPTGYALAVESTPPTGLGIVSSTGQSGTTNYGKVLGAGTPVNLQAPETNPSGYTFSQWTVNGVAQTAGQKSITFTTEEVDMTAVAEYTLDGYALAVESTPPTGLGIASSTGQDGTTNYTVAGATYGTSVNLQAPKTDPAGYSFSKWTVNGAAQTAGEKSVTFTMDGAVTAVAQYTANPGYTLSVQSTPKGLSIGSSTGQNGTTNYTKSGVGYGASVNLQAPATDPTGLYTFSQWTLNGAAQPPGENSITFTMEGAATAVAQYTANPGYTLSVQSAPKGQLITSSTSDGGITPYTVSGVPYSTSVNLQAPETGPAGYIFSQWLVNGAAQPAGQKGITFTMEAATTAEAVYIKDTP
jgi:DNA-binding beta-propeller fold protein YncE